jgi:hypothetical protein
MAGSLRYIVGLDSRATILCGHGIVQVCLDTGAILSGVVNMKLRVTFLCLSITLVMGCASSQMVKVASLVNPNQKSYFSEGRQVIVSTFGDISVSLAPAAAVFKLGNNHKFDLGVANDSDRMVNLFANEISAQYADSGQAIDVKEHDEILIGLEDYYGKRRAGLALQGMGAGMSGDAQEMANFNQQKSAFESEYSKQMQEINLNIVKDTTIFAHSSYQAQVWLEPLEVAGVQVIMIDLVVDNLTHSFKFQNSIIVNSD